MSWGARWALAVCLICGVTPWGSDGSTSAAREVRVIAGGVAAGSVTARTAVVDSAGPVGTSGWRLSKPALARQIEGYTTKVSVLPGQRVGLKVSTAAERFRVAAFRFGWYHHHWARRVWSSGWFRGSRQASPVFFRERTRTIVAPWKRSLTVSTAGWRPGVYVFKLIAGTGWQAHVPFMVRSPSALGRVALVAPVATWQAYNDWGGYSLYTGPPGDRRSWAVSFNRPYPPPGAGRTQMMHGAVPIAVLAARLNIPLAYLTNVDVAADAGALKGARGFVDISHDEYWSRAMRRHVTRARRAGTNLAFLGANTMYWRIRLEDTPNGPNRLEVGYRSDAALDPVAQHHPGRTTARWRDRPVPNPENRVIGMLYECFPVDAPYRVMTPRWWGFRHTGVVHGTTFAHLVGPEADRVYPIRSTPRPLQILSYAKYSCGGVGTSTQSTYYTGPSGAAVFTAGTLRWTCALVRRCQPFILPKRTQRFVRIVTSNVMRLFAKGPAGRRFPARDNVANFHLPPINQVPASREARPPRHDRWTWKLPRT
jgi:hypothetical protein